MKCDCSDSFTIPFQTSEDMDSLDGDSVVDNADTNKNVSTNPLTSMSFATVLSSLSYSLIYICSLLSLPFHF